MSEEEKQEYSTQEQNGFESKEVENKTSVTKCPACGADMVFDALTGQMRCAHCGTMQEILSRGSEEYYMERLESEPEVAGWTGSHVFRCENCGAVEIIEGQEIAKQCSFCGATNVVETNELPRVRPNAIVPFRLPEEQASACVKKWARKRIWAPLKFQKSAKPENLHGVYTPAFTFDAMTYSTYAARLGEYYYETRRVNGRTERVRKIRYFNVSGSFDMNFDDILIQAGGNIRQEDLDKMQPFQTNESLEYKKDFLSGYTAMQNSKSGQQCWEEAQERMQELLRQAILAQYSYDEVVSFNCDTDYSDETFKYILLPVYVGHCSWKQKLYNFFVNGLNGKTTGKAPVSPWKVTIASVLGAAALFGLYYLFIVLIDGGF